MTDESVAEELAPMEGAIVSADGLRQQWAYTINARWQDSVDAIIDVGRLLMQAKHELVRHGQWLKLFENKELPFGERTAQMLMRVSSKHQITNTKHASYLPSSWNTLYELSRLDDATWELALEDGKIHPEMERKDVALLLDEQRRRKAAPVDLVEPSDNTCTVDDLHTLIERGAQFGTIYADPPWLYGNQATRASTGNHYEGMTVEEISQLPIAELAAENAHLHLWTTNAFLFDCKAIMEAWGFEYKSCLVWVKPQMGIGNYWRVSHEFLLFGVRGSCPFLDRSQMSWIQESRTKHSAKPETIRKMIEMVSPGPRLELFGRRVARDWVVWGNQIERNMFETLVRAI
jgi:N6-adenosine-specific RNA methylase IME4